MGKTLVIEPVTRIEGHAKVTIDINDNDEVVKGHLQVLEIRGFEKFVERMELVKMPLITARICGVCPAAHHLAAAKAIENGCKVTIPPEAALLRELLYMGHVLHSHALSCFVLLGPDVLKGIDAKAADRNIFKLLASDPEVAKKALRLRSVGQKIVEVVGGRGIHPVTAIPGGISCRPSPEEMTNIAGWGKEALAILTELQPAVLAALGKLETVRQAAMLEAFPMALSKNGVLSFLEGNCEVIDLAAKKERSFTESEYDKNLQEQVMPGSYMKSVFLKGPASQRVFVGPLARINVNGSFSTPKATAMLNEFKSAGLRLSVLDNIEARLIEMVHCAERIVEIASLPPQNGPLFVTVNPKAGRYVGIVEAPRGILIHDFSANDEGQVTSANLIVATQNNYDAINLAITALAKHFKPKNDDNQLTNGIEFAVRCFDPCLSCATHAAGRMPMRIDICKSGTIIRTLTRE